MRIGLLMMASALALSTPPARADAPASGASAQGVSVYPASFFAKNAPLTALDMVQLLPGFTLDTGNNVRGFDDAAGNVLIDGRRPVAKNDTLDNILKRIPAESVEHIEVIRGGAPGVDMQGKTVLANVVRKAGAGFNGLAAAATNFVYDGRTLSSVRLEGRKTWGERSFEAGINGGEGADDGAGGGPRTRTSSSGVVLSRAAELTHGTGLTISATGAYEQKLAGGDLRVSGSYLFNPYRYEQVDIYPAPRPFEPERDHDKDQKGEFGVSYNRSLTQKVRFEGLLLDRLENDQFFSALRDSNGVFSKFSLSKDIQEVIGRGALKLAATPSLSLQAGGEGAFNTLDSKTAYIVNMANIAVPAANVRVEEKRAQAFAAATWKPLASLTLEAGLRYETSTITASGDVVLQKTLSFTKPRGVATWTPTASDQFRVRVEREIGQLNFDDFVASSQIANTGTITAGNPDINPQQSWTYEAAYERHFGKTADFTITVRHYDLKDVVDRIPVFVGGDAFDSPGNIGDGTKDEVALGATLPLDWAGLKTGLLKATATWRKSSVTDPSTGRQREITKLRPMEWEAHYSQDLPAWRTKWGIDAFGGWRETYYLADEIDSDKLKTFVIVYNEFRLGHGLSFRTEIDNATARGFRHERQVFAGPRGANPFAFLDDRDLHFGRMLYFRLRKTL